MQKILNDCYPYLKGQGSLGNLLSNYGDGNSVNTWGNPATKKLVEDAKAYGKQLAAQVNAGGSGGLEAEKVGADCFKFTQIPTNGEFSTSYEVKTATGETITDFSILTPSGDIISSKDDLSKYIKEGDICRIISNEEGKTVGYSKVNASTSSEVMNGRMMICASANGRAQARIMLFGDKRPQNDETSTESGTPPEDDNPPVIVIEKYDAYTGGKLNGVQLQANIDYGYYSQVGEGNNFTIYFGDLLASDSLLQAELSDPYTNNAAKLLDPKYETGIDLSQGTLSSYVYGEIVKNLMPRVTGSPTYQMWAAHVAACRCPHGTHHGEGVCYYQSCGDPDCTSCPHPVACGQHCCHLCPEYQEAMAAAQAAVYKFAEKYCKDTDKVRDWLYDYAISTSDSGIRFGSNKHSIPHGEIDPVPFIYSAYTWYQANLATPIKCSNLLQVYTGDLRVDMTELQTAPGYLLWKNENTKTLTIKYDGGDVVNPLDIYTNSEPTYDNHTNDQVEMEHDGIKSSPSDGTYDVTRIKCYNQPDNTVTLQFNKYGELTDHEKSLNATFQITLKATETYWNGQRRVKTATYNKTTSNGKIEFTSKDYWERLGIDVISRWSGTIDVTIKEVATDKNYLLWDHEKSFKIKYDWGKSSIIEENEGAGEDAIVETPEQVRVRLDAYNTPKDAPQIILHKNEIGGSALEGAVFDATIQGNGRTVNLTGLKTNDAGEIRINAEDLYGLRIDVINRWTGTITVTLKETKAPDGYELIEEPIIVTINYNHGIITSVTSSNQKVEGTTPDTSYTDNGGDRGVAPSAVITIEDALANKLRIRKVTGDIDKNNIKYQEYLTGARFDVSITTKPLGNSREITRDFDNLSVDNKGYIDITEQVNAMIEPTGKTLGTYSGTITVKMRERVAPDGYPRIEDEIEVTLTYINGYLRRVDYPSDDKLSQTIIDVGDSEDGKTVTIAVKNNKTQPIYISKVDSVTGKTLSNVDFKISVSTSEIHKLDELTGKIDTKIYKTNDDGLMEIPVDTLKTLGITDSYSGSLYILMEEIGTKPGYKTLSEEIYVRVEYDQGVIKSARVISSNSNTISNKDRATCSITKDGLLKVTVNNDKQMPDLIISKETLTNNKTDAITSAVLDIVISAKGRSISINQQVDNSAEIIISGDRLEKELGITAADTTTITVDIDEKSVDQGAVLLPEKVTATIPFIEGKFTDGTVSNGAHLSLVDNGSKVIVKVVDDIIRKKTIIISGIVWQELATTKGADVLKDGLYTTASDSENSDRLFEGIEVTLYQKTGNSLEFVKNLDGTNPTLTDEKGYYEFTGLQDASNYVVKFVYNGQEFEAAASSEDTEYSGTKEVENTNSSAPTDDTTSFDINGKCTTCDGVGTITRTEYETKTVTETQTCGHCDGTGKITENCPHEYFNITITEKITDANALDGVYSGSEECASCGRKISRSQYKEWNNKTGKYENKITFNGALKAKYNAVCSIHTNSGAKTFDEWFCNENCLQKKLGHPGHLPEIAGHDYTYTCGSCQGKGYKSVERKVSVPVTKTETCPDCQGKGEITNVLDVGQGQNGSSYEGTGERIVVDCTKCNGTGKTLQEKCSVCNGVGNVEIQCPGTKRLTDLQEYKLVGGLPASPTCAACGKKYTENVGSGNWKYNYMCYSCGNDGYYYVCSEACGNALKQKESTLDLKCTTKLRTICTACNETGNASGLPSEICPECNGVGKIITTASGSQRENFVEYADTASDIEKISSKASEVTNTRKDLNRGFSEIGSYPASYRIMTNNGESLFKDVMNSGYAGLSSGNAQSIAIKESLLSGYNEAYLYQEIKDVYDKVRLETRTYLGEHKFIEDGDVNAYRTIYINVANNHYRDSSGKLIDDEIFSKLQFIYDSRLDAYAGHYTKEGGVESSLSVDTYGEYRYVNLGLIARDKTDLTLAKDLYESTVSINGYDTTYKYDKDLGTYKQYIYEEDYNYYGNPTHNVGDLKSDGLAKYDNDQIELYLKYKITVQNTTNTITKLTEVTDYFDYRFGYKDIYKTSANNEVAGLRVVRVDKDGKVTPIADSLEDRNKADGDRNAVVNATSKYYNNYQGASKLGTADSDGKYNQLFVTFAEGQEPILVDNGEKIEIYVTIKLGQDNEAKIKSTYDNNQKMAKDVLYDFMHGIDPNDNDNNNTIMSIFNYAEINGYKTLNADGSEGGFLDADSKPGTFVVNDYDKARKEYLDAYKTRKEDEERFAKALDKLKEIRQDDAWGELIQLENNPISNEDKNYYHRTMSGNVWEAISDKVKTSTDLYSDKLLTYINQNGVGGIIVELVELETTVNENGSLNRNNGAQVVRARAVTSDDGSYTFKNFIAGDYTVRFTYGSAGNSDFTEEQNSRIKETSISERNTFYGINGQYYQSTKANPETDVVKYWYAKYAGDKENPTYEASSNPGVTGDKNTSRYSDAYDDVNTRIAQIEAKTAGTEDTLKATNDRTVIDNSWSWNYEWDGTENVQKTADDKHIDQIDAYTSTMNIEIEYTKPQIEGNQEPDFYRYVISDVDFGLTPRAEAKMTIDKYVSNVKLYLQDGTKQLDVDIDKSGATTYKNDAMYNNIVIPTGNTEVFKDGLLEVLFDEQLLNGTTLEITYTITTTNDGQPNTITYFYEKAPDTEVTTPVAIAYYIGNGESLENLVSYEGDRKYIREDERTLHNSPVVNHTTSNVFNVQNAGFDLGLEVRTRATNIVDYVDPNLNFIQTNKAGESINRNWELTTINDFNTTREANDGIMAKYNTIIRAKGGETYANYLDYLADMYRVTKNGKVEDRYTVTEGNNKSNLYIPILPGERNVTTLTLSKVLETTSTGTNDYEYSNLIELAKLENYAGKSVRMEGYDITGETDRETSKIMRLEDITDPYIKTLGTSKSATISIHAPTGLSISEEAQANLSIVLVVLIVFAAGVVLIKKYVLTPKNNE